MVWKILVPIIIMMIGFSFIFKTKKVRIFKPGVRSYDAIFGDIDEKLNEIDDNIKATSIFGDIDLDLRSAKIKKDIYIDCTTIFGDITLRLPMNVRLKVNGIPIFGEVNNKYDENKDGKYIIDINYTCVFGEVDII